MSNPDVHTDILRGTCTETVQRPLEVTSSSVGTLVCPPVPETPRRTPPSRAQTVAPPPLDNYHGQDPSIHRDRPCSPESSVSTATLSGSLFGNITGNRLVAEPEPLERKHGAVALAQCPVTFISGMRYSRRDKLNYDELEAAGTIIKTVPPMNKIKHRPESLGKLGWKPYEHPEGSVYFRAKNFFTNLWLYDEADLEAVERTVDQICKVFAHWQAKDPQLLGDDVEFGIDLVDDEADDAKPGDKLGCYYAVSLRDEEAFWLHEVGANFFCDNSELQIISREHLGCGARMGYWDHVYMFPHGRMLPPHTVTKLRAIVSYHMFDKETSRSSTSPYSSDDAHRLLQALKEIEHYSQGQDAHPEHMVMTARMQCTLYREKLYRFHGERYAQLDSDKSVFAEEPSRHHRSKTFTLFSWLFFLTPHLYLERLSHTWVDNKINYDHWSNFISELQEDWAASITPSTIILSANVGFLAIQSVDLGGNALRDRTMGQIISYISTLLSLGNIVACTILSAQHRKSTHRYSENAIAYLCGRALSRGGMENLAVIFSIPAAFFLWGLVTFFIAIYWVCMHDTSGITRIAVSIIAAISILLVAVILRNSDWKSQPSIYSIAIKVQKMHGMVKRAPATAATRWKMLSRTLSESGLSKFMSVPRRMPSRRRRRRTTQLLGSEHTTIAEEGEIDLMRQGPEAV
ncbi:hypothetical protein GSI_14780 [Ganoderma sinense ZZ0214-1]|uniref:Uncharacterized protein n=1 Tax=Ganoderma sinense ZZ0214-1 TaxID=1077348 RepID=A0A2G8RPN5_9APHY|nr:hypothetical protein GSI_14780 [Ganoderma sinense ZZ0214-1]